MGLSVLDLLVVNLLVVSIYSLTLARPHTHPQALSLLTNVFLMSKAAGMRDKFGKNKMLSWLGFASV